jgi:hypothetical protein
VSVTSASAVAAITVAIPASPTTTTATTTAVSTTATTVSATTATAVSTASTASASAASEAASTATATTTGARLTLFGLVHAERAAFEHGAVHLLNGGLGELGIAHGHEAEASRLTGRAIHDHVDIGDFANLGER